jgi:hypothetical protein
MKLEQALKLVEGFFEKEPEKYKLWMTTDNPMLGDISPELMIAIGREEKLIKFIKHQLMDE